MRAFRKRKHSSNRRIAAGHTKSVPAASHLLLEQLEQRCVLSTWHGVGPSPIMNGQVENIIPDNEAAGAVQTVVAHPTNPDVLYIGTTNGGVWRTDNATMTRPDWVPLTDDLPSLSIRDLRMDPTDPERLIASVGISSSFQEGGERSGVYITEDGGATWSVISDPLFAGENVRAAEIRGMTIIIGTSDEETNGTHDAFGGGLYRSDDAGGSWTRIDFEFQNPNRIEGISFDYSVLDLVADPSTLAGAESRFYALVVTTTLEDDFRGIYMTEDSGATWENITAGARRAPITAAEFEISDTIAPPDIQDAILGRIRRQVEDGDAVTIVEVPYLDEQALPIFPGDLNNAKLSVSADGGRLYAMIADSGVVKYIGYAEIESTIGLGSNVDVGAIDWVAMDLPSIPGVFRAIQGLNPRVKPGGQGAFHLSLLADPNDRNILYVGGDRQDTSGDVLGNFIGAHDFSGSIWRGDATYLSSLGIIDGGTGDLPEPVGRELLPPAILLRNENLVTVVQDTPSSQWSHLTHDDDVLRIPLGGTANSSAPHADSRDLVFDSRGELIEADDGGIYRRTSPLDNSGDWYSLNGNLQITEFHNIAFDTTSNIIFGGAQDVGTPQQTAEGELSWAVVQVFDIVVDQGLANPLRLNADGGDVAVDDSQGHRSYRYSSSQGTGLIRRQVFNADNEFIEQTFLTLPAGFAPSFVTPIEINAVNGSRLLIVGQTGIYESLDRGDTFTMVAGIGNPSQSVDSNAVVYGGRKAGRANAGVIYVGFRNEIVIRKEDGEFTTADDGTVTVEPTSVELTRAQFPGGDIKDIVLDSDDWMTAYVTGSRGIWKTTNAGETWTDITGDLTASFIKPVQFIEAATGDHVVLGTNRGVMTMDVSEPGVWRLLAADMPNALVYDLDYDATDDVLVAGTLGRGAWMLHAASVEATAALTAPPPGTPPTLPVADPGSVTGTVFGDANSNGVQDAGEMGLAGILIYVDLDGDGQPGVSEPKGISDAAGVFVVSDVPVGTHTLKVAPTAGDLATFTLSDSQTVTVSESATTVTAPFAALPRLDYGDAPSPYPTLAADDGPSHGRVPELFLGASVDGELDGQVDDGADEDGVLFVTGLMPGTTATLAVIASQPANLHGYLNAWIDFNGDGDLSDPGEHVAVNVRLDDGPNSIPIAVPAGAGAVDTLARFRWSYEKDISFTGSVFAGEVEDYLVSIPMDSSGGSTAVDDTFDAVEDMVDPATFDVLANDFPDIFGGDLSVEIPSGQSINGTVTTDGSVVFYTSDADFFGVDTFVYERVDSLGTKSTATVTVNVAGRNDPPTAVDDDLAVGSNTSQNLLDLTANDLIAPDTGETLVITSVGATSAGGTVSISADGSSVRYTPLADFLGTDTFSYVISDGNGGMATGMATVEVVQPLFVNFHLEATDSLGNIVTDINVGDTFQLRGFVEDTRPMPLGVFSAYLDVLYDPLLVSTSGPAAFGSFYSRGTNADFSTTGIVNAIGGTTDPFAPAPGSGEFLLFNVPFTARNGGTVTFETAFEDNLPLRAVTLFGESVAVSEEMITFGTTSLSLSGVTANNDELTVFEDSGGNVLDVLDNDVGTDPLTIKMPLVSQPPNGSVTIIELPSGSDGILYTPNADFQGVDMFEYTVVDADGIEGTGLVTVNVTNVNDDPMANDDLVDIGSASVVTLDVLANDTDAPDMNEELIITAVTQPAEGGTVTISGDGLSLEFTPDGVNTTTTFTYTIEDGNGGSDTATVNLEINDNVVVFRPQLTTLGGDPLSGPLEFGDEFLLSVFTRDRRAMPTGVFSAYLDVVYDSTLVAVTGPLDFSNGQYTGAVSGSTDLAGLIDEVGGTDGTVPLGGGEFLVFEVPFRVTRSQQATTTFTTNASDQLPLHEVSLFGDTTTVDDDLVEYQSVELQLEGDGARNDEFTVSEDTTTNLDVLENDIAPTGLGPLTIDSLTQDPSAGGTATIIPDPGDPARMVIEYTPPADFPIGLDSAVETFRYRARDIAGTLTEGIVSVTVLNTPDPPVANDDSRIVQVGSTTQFDLLANDSNDPDPDTDLTIIDISQPVGGGSVTFDPGTSGPVTFTAPDGAGEVTFTYTMRDVDGLTDTATVTVDVSTSAPPVMGFLFEVTDTDGAPLDSVTTGVSFLLNVSVEDLREVPRGVFSAYLDVIVSGSGTVTSDGPIQYNELVFPSVQRGVLGTSPLVDELGAVDGAATADPSGTVLLATIPLVGTSVGDITFSGDPADILPPNETTLFGEFTIVAPDQQDFGFDSVSIVSPPSSSTVLVDVDGNGYVTPLDALLVINELAGENPQAANSSFSIVQSYRSRYDVNGDGNVTPLDALYVINELANQGSSIAPRSSSSTVIAAAVESPKTETAPTFHTAGVQTLSADLRARASANLIRHIVADPAEKASDSAITDEAALDLVLASRSEAAAPHRTPRDTWPQLSADSTEPQSFHAFDEVFTELDELATTITPKT